MPKRQLDISDIQALGFDVEEVLPRVFKIQNFVTAEELATLMEEVSSYSEESWSDRYLAEMKKNSLAKFGRDDIDNLRAEGLLEVTETFIDKDHGVENFELVQVMIRRLQQIFDRVGNLQVAGFNTFQRMYEGETLIAHFDQYSDKLIEYATVLYLNDDYTGGPLSFVKFAADFNPAPGTLMLFPGTEEYEHEVKEVGKGPIRYVMPTFVKRLDPGGIMAGWANFG